MAGARHVTEEAWCKFQCYRIAQKEDARKRDREIRLVDVGMVDGIVSLTFRDDKVSKRSRR
jgi:hypothetical protein